jgi:hypothetical protein
MMRIHMHAEMAPAEVTASEMAPAKMTTAEMRATEVAAAVTAPGERWRQAEAAEGQCNGRPKDGRGTEKVHFMMAHCALPPLARQLNDKSRPIRKA